MRALALVLLILVTPLAFAQDGTVEVTAKPTNITPSGQGFITIAATRMKVVRVYVDGLYQGRRYLNNPRGGRTQNVRMLLSFPGTAAKGRYKIRIEGKDADGEEITAVETFVSPTRDRDVRTELIVRAPGSVSAPAASLYTRSTAVDIKPDARYKLTISPATATVVPGQKITFTVKVFEGSVEVPDLTPTLTASSGSFEGTVYTASNVAGRQRIVARFGDGVISARVDIAQPVNIEVTSWGIHQLRLSGATFGQPGIFVDPNIRPTTTVRGGILPADKGKTVEIKIEGLDNSDPVKVLTAKSVLVVVR